MKRRRLHLPGPWAASVALAPEKAHYLRKVLRLSPGSALEVFDGAGRRAEATLVMRDGTPSLDLADAVLDLSAESPLRVHVVQAVARGERMDHTLQKCTELGASAFTVFFSQRSEVKLSGERLDKRLAHWSGVIAAACEQSGRTRVPELHFAESLPPPPSLPGLILVPGAAAIGAVSPAEEVSILVGPEGGFEDQEVASAATLGWQPAGLGPRILRSETAGPAAVACLGALFGDLT